MLKHVFLDKVTKVGVQNRRVTLCFSKKNVSLFFSLSIASVFPWNWINVFPRKIDELTPFLPLDNSAGAILYY